jgi:hypothetical protein
MKQYILVIVCNVLLIQSHAQVVKPQATATQVKEMEKTPALSNYADKLSNAKKQESNEKVNAAMAYLYKAVLHRSDKTKYPADNSDAMEKRMIETVSGLSPKMYEKANSHVQAALVDNNKKVKDLGKYADLVFAGKPLAEQMQKKGFEFQKVEVATPKINDILPLNVALSGVYCVDETNPESGDDDIIVSGMFLSAGNKMTAGDALFCGYFNDGAYGVYDNIIGAIKYARKESFPQVYYAVIVLYEATKPKGSENEAVQELNAALRALVAMAVSTTEGMDAETTASAMVNIIGNFGGLFLDDKLFPPYAIKIELKAPNDVYVSDTKVTFNSGVSGEFTTNSISGHGGSYKASFKLKR